MVGRKNPTLTWRGSLDFYSSIPGCTSTASMHNTLQADANGMNAQIHRVQTPYIHVQALHNNYGTVLKFYSESIFLQLIPIKPREKPSYCPLWQMYVYIIHVSNSSERQNHLSSQCISMSYRKCPEQLTQLAMSVHSHVWDVRLISTRNSVARYDNCEPLPQKLYRGNASTDGKVH